MRTVKRFRLNVVLCATFVALQFLTMGGKTVAGFGANHISAASNKSFGSSCQMEIKEKHVSTIVGPPVKVTNTVAADCQNVLTETSQGPLNSFIHAMSVGEGISSERLMAHLSGALKLNFGWSWTTSVGSTVAYTCNIKSGHEAYLMVFPEFGRLTGIVEEKCGQKLGTKRSRFEYKVPLKTDRDEIKGERRCVSQRYKTCSMTDNDEAGLVIESQPLVKNSSNSPPVIHLVSFLPVSLFTLCLLYCPFI